MKAANRALVLLLESWAILCAPLAAFADEVDAGPAADGGVTDWPEPEAGDAYETVVTASRSECERFDAPRSIELVDEQRMAEQQARSLPEATAETTGVHLQQTNRGAGAPIIRGLIGPQNLILHSFGLPGFMQRPGQC